MGSSYHKDFVRVVRIKISGYQWEFSIVLIKHRSSTAINLIIDCLYRQREVA